METHDLKEQLDRRRNQMLRGFLIGFTLWQALTILEKLHGPTSPWLERGVSIAALLAGLYWAIQLLRMVGMLRTLKQQPELASALNDEYVREKRQRAFAFSIWPVLVTQGALIALNHLHYRMDAGVGAQLTILVAVAGALGAYLYFDRE